jgi:hypothetical protein
MAIQFNLPNIVGDNPLKSSVPDYMSAIKQGMELGYMPRTHQNTEFGKELANKINEAKAKYAMQQEAATLQGKQGELSLLPLRRQMLQAQYDAQLSKAKQAKFYQDMMNDYFSDKRNNVGSTVAEPKTEAPTSFAEQLLRSNPKEEFTPGGQGMFAPQPEPSPQPTGQQLPFGINKDDFMKAMFYKQAGLTPPTNKEAALTGSARDAESMLRLKQQYGENSTVVKQAEAIEKAKSQRQEDLSDIRHRQLNGLKPGDTEIKDPNTGQTIGFKKQTTEKQKESAKNISLFNSLYPLAFKGAAPFSGPGATFKMEEAARKYNTDKKSAKMIDDLLVADKALTNTTVSEASRFQAGRTNQTYNRYAESLKADDVSARIKKWIKEGLVPASANLKAGMRWQQELNKAEKKALKSIPATQDYYFDPDKQFEHEQNMHHGNESEEIEDEKIINGKTYVKENGKWYEK